MARKNLSVPEMTFQEVAKTILQQLGGFGKLRAMIGIYSVVALGESDQEDRGGVQFGFKGSRKVNKCRIILDHSDTYTFELWKITKKSWDKVYELSGVYFDMLIDLFESETGLDLSL